MDDLKELKVFYEQQAYAEIRAALQADYLQEPEAFIKHFGVRPEDLTGQTLREFYPHFLVQQRPLSSVHNGFCKRFLSGNLFTPIKMREFSILKQEGEYAYV